MLESIALHAGYRVGLYIKPHLVHFEERCRVDGETVDGRRAAAALRGGRGGARRRRADLLRVHHAGDPARAVAARRSTCVILEVGLGGRLDAVNVVRRRLRGHHQHRHRPRRVPRPRPRERSAARRPASCAPGRPAIVSDPHAAAERDRRMRARIGADLWLLGRDFNYAGDRQQWSLGRAPAALQRPRLPGAARRQPAAQRRRRAGRVRGAARARCRSARRRCAPGFALVELPGRFQIVPGQPTLVLDVAHNPHAVARAGAEPRPDGLLPAHACGVRRDARQGPGRRSCTRMAPLVDAWHFTDLPTPRAAARRRSGARCVATRACASAARDACMPCRPARRAAPRRWPRQTPLIESSSSARSTPWAAC